MYIGETGRAMHERIKEHDRDIRLLLQNTLARSVKFIHRDPHWYTCRIKEVIHVRLHPNNDTLSIKQSHRLIKTSSNSSRNVAINIVRQMNKHSPIVHTTMNNSHIFINNKVCVLYETMINLFGVKSAILKWQN